MEDPEREYGIPFTLASVQTLHSQPGLGMVVAPPEPKTTNSISLPFGSNNLKHYASHSGVRALCPKTNVVLQRVDASAYIFWCFYWLLEFMEYDYWFEDKKFHKGRR